MTIPNLTPAVARAIEELRAAFPDAAISAREDSEGGAWVIVEPVSLGAPYVQAETWWGFHITFQYPNADVYPLFVREDLARFDGGPLGEGTSKSEFEGRAAVQLSRRSNRLNPATDTAALKVLKVLEWLRAR